MFNKIYCSWNLKNAWFVLEILCLLALSVKLMTFLLSKIENEKIFSQVIGSGKNCDQNGDRVSKYHEKCHICNTRLKKAFGEILKIWDSAVYVYVHQIENVVWEGGWLNQCYTKSTIA